MININIQMYANNNHNYNIIQIVMNKATKQVDWRD